VNVIVICRRVEGAVLLISQSSGWGGGPKGSRGRGEEREGGGGGKSAPGDVQSSNQDYQGRRTLRRCHLHHDCAPLSPLSPRLPILATPSYRIYCLPAAPHAGPDGQLQAHVISAIGTSRFHCLVQNTFIPHPRPPVRRYQMPLT
jgi:hypothetical protein